MPPGSFDLHPGGAATAPGPASGLRGTANPSGAPMVQAIAAAPVIVCRFNEEAAGRDENPYTILPNVRCIRIDYREGPEPPVARFRYMMDDLLQASLSWPSQFEQLWPIDAKGQYVVLTDDRLVVLTQMSAASTADGQPSVFVMFDGFAQVPQVDISGGQQAVTFAAIGVAIRLWDTPLKDRWQRDAARTDVTDGTADVPVQLPCRFNPADTSIGSLGGYIGNCVPPGQVTEEGSNKFPVFLDPLCALRADPALGNFDTSFWMVSDALSYLVALYPSPKDDAGNPFVSYPSIKTIQSVLTALVPPSGRGTVNSSNAVSADIKIRDYDASNKAVPDAMAELLRYCGFVMVFVTETDAGNSTPTTKLRMVRRDGLSTQTPKLLYLAASGGGGVLDLAANNATELHLARDGNDVVNQWTVETALKQVEITVSLAPGFEPSSTDQAPTFFLSNLTNPSVPMTRRKKYRWWIADECGDGHWNADTEEWVKDQAIDFSVIFPNDKDGNSTYVDRYRPGSNVLISKDKDGRPLKSVLEYLGGTTSDDPAIWDAPPTPAIVIPHGHGWKMLEDQLGIELTMNNPDEWVIKGDNQIAAVNAGQTHIPVVTWMANPDPKTNFMLRLTTVVEADERIPYEDVTALGRVASPNLYDIERAIDGKDHFQYCTVSKGSLYYKTSGGDGTNDYVARDDTKAALAHAQQLRSAHEFPTLAGSATIPYLTNYYQIGDRVKIVYGRNASLQINVGTDKGETPSYPWIVAYSWLMEGDRQATVLQFSDRRAEPQGV
jgi:hypothetical protein